MAKKLVTTTFCDLHPPAEQVPGTPLRFGLDGWIYELDACGSCAAALRSTLGQFTGRARRAGVLAELLPDRVPLELVATVLHGPHWTRAGVSR